MKNKAKQRNMQMKQSRPKFLLDPFIFREGVPPSNNCYKGAPPYTLDALDPKNSLNF
jgi:hypothetical protein